ncbi:hypothetical protein [Novosphingobium lentum]|uniref:hypothetical protein n=1 Tax=Novosphingobium lentum TaxID=145287 RepID=UPI00082D810F|nr:hypothetical protein [Novosphingobium lentum]
MPLRHSFRSGLVGACAALAALGLSACDRKPAAPADPALTAQASAIASETAAGTYVAPTPAPSVPEPSATPTPDVNTPSVPSASRDPGEVLAAWAKAIEARDWATVRSYWGDHGARSGLSPKAFAAKWSDLLDPRVSIAPGTQEGGAGSLYYTAPVTITDGKRKIAGEITIRRVNDVDGASPEQLRWHIESTTLRW